MAQAVKCFLPKHEDKSSVLSTRIIVKLVSVVPSLRVGRQIPGVCWLASLAKLVSSRFSERPCLKNQGREQWRETVDVVL